MEFPLQNGGTLAHFLAQTDLDARPLLRAQVFKSLLANAVANVERLWAKQLVHAGLSPDCLYIDDRGRLVLGDFEHVVHERLGVHDMLLLVFSQLLCERERRAQDAPGREGLLRETKADASRSFGEDFASLSVLGLRGAVIFSENLSLSLKSPAAVFTESRDLQRTARFLRRAGEPPAGRAMPRTLSFKNIASPRGVPRARARARRLFFAFDPSFEAQKAKGIAGLEYRPPEFAQSGVVSRASDLWGLGCVAYECFYRDALFDLRASRVSAEQLRIYIANFDIAKSERRFQKIPEAARGLFRALLTKCPFERELRFCARGVRGSDCFAGAFEALLRGPPPIEFRYNAAHEFGERSCFLDSIRYKIAKQFRAQAKTLSAKARAERRGPENRRANSGAPRADEGCAAKPGDRNGPRARVPRALLLKKPRRRKKKKGKPNEFRSKIERQIHRLKRQTLAPRKAPRAGAKKRARAKPKRKARRKAKASRFFCLPSPGASFLQNERSPRKKKAVSNRNLVFGNFESFRRSFSNRTRHTFHSGK